MPTMDMQTQLSAPPGVVYDFLADPSNETAWNPDVKAIRSVGERAWEGDYKGMGTMRIELVEAERPTRLLFRTTGSRMDMLFEFRFAPARDGQATDLVAHGDATPKGAMKLMTPLMGAMFRRTMAKRPGQMADALATDAARRRGA